MQPHGPLKTLLVVGLVVIIASSVGMAWVAGTVVEGRLVALDAQHISAHVRQEAVDHLASGEGLERFGHDLLKLPGVFRLKIYDPSGRIVWSNEPNLIGRTFSDNDELARALAGQTVVGVVETVKGAEHQYERAVPLARELYIPVLAGDGATRGVVEVYLDAAPTEAQVRQAQRALVGLSTVAALILYGLLMLAVWRASVALRRASQRERTEIEERFRLVERLRAFGEVAAGATHDLANVFTIITGRLGMILRAPDVPAAVASELKMIDGAAADGVDIMRRLRHLSRADDRRDAEPVSLSAVVADVVKLVEPRWRSRTDLEVVPALGDVSPVLGHGSELREVVMNLVLNALDAMPAGGRLTMRTAQQNGHVLVEVADTGIGMSADVRERLFTPFFTTKRDGTGLGLAVSYGIVKRHGGHVDVQTAPGHGTRFIVKLPAVKRAGDLPR